jgi:hypothetical protein
MAHLDASIQGYLRIPPTIQKSERKYFYRVDNFSDDLLVIEYSLPRFATVTLVPVHADERRRENSQRVDDFNRNWNVSLAYIHERYQSQIGSCGTLLGLGIKKNQVGLCFFIIKTNY